MYFPTVHIAGTNGKGSTASMIAAILTASGYRTGLYTSPHLADFSERIRIDGKNISFDEIIQYTRTLRPIIDKQKATFFEATTAIAFRYFADQHVDVAVIETGLGGRLDATNVLTPMVSVITNIGLEHTQYLGDTIEKIACEKAGIIKPFTPCITGVSQKEVINVLDRFAQKNQANLIHARSKTKLRLHDHTLDGIGLDVMTESHAIRDIHISLAGDHQLDNVCVAATVISFLHRTEGFKKIKPQTIINGLSRIQQYTGFRGRLDVLQRSPLIIADAAHNEDGLGQLHNSLNLLVQGRCIVVFGVMKDKLYTAMIERLSQISQCAVAVSPKTERALEADRIVQEFHFHSKYAILGGSVAQGLKIASQEAFSRDYILVTGSHYVVGEAMKKMGISTINT